MNILITGAFGFVGSNLSAALASAQKHRLIAVDLVQLVAQSPPAEYFSCYSEFVSWDQLHTLTGRNIDAVIHLAGKAHDTRNTAIHLFQFGKRLCAHRNGQTFRSKDVVHRFGFGGFPRSDLYVSIRRFNERTEFTELKALAA
jgi:NAD dependent epimerase/dehydratase family enzyme